MCEAIPRPKENVKTDKYRDITQELLTLCDINWSLVLLLYGLLKTI